LSYLCQNTENKGKVIFRGNLKKMFSRFDSDNNGCLDPSEIKKLLRMSFKEHIKDYRVIIIYYLVYYILHE
jgi:hypothetical protein